MIKWLNLFKNNRDNRKTLYLATYEQSFNMDLLPDCEVIFNGDELCKQFMATQVVDKETAYYAGCSSVQLIFEDDKLVEAYNLEYGESLSPRPLADSEVGLIYPALEPHPVYIIDLTEAGLSYLGGRPPETFQMPDCGLHSSIQYLGMLSHQEDMLSWLPIDLHLIAPIYLAFHRFFVDYSDPMRPVVFNVDEMRAAPILAEWLKVSPEFEIYFKQRFISFKNLREHEDEFENGHIGVPYWIQFPYFPICPKTNQMMTFVCQLSFQCDVETEFTNYSPDDELFGAFTRMDFWDDGDLFVFFHPESKVACYFIQCPDVKPLC